MGLSSNTGLSVASTQRDEGVGGLSAFGGLSGGGGLASFGADVGGSGLGGGSIWGPSTDSGMMGFASMSRAPESLPRDGGSARSVDDNDSADGDGEGIAADAVSSLFQ